MAVHAFSFHLTPNIGRDEWHIIAFAGHMGLTAYTPEKSLSPMFGVLMIAFNINVSAIEEVDITSRTLRQFCRDMAIIFGSHMVASFLMPPRSISPSVSRITFGIPFTTVAIGIT